MKWAKLAVGHQTNMQTECQKNLKTKTKGNQIQSSPTRQIEHKKVQDSEN